MRKRKQEQPGGIGKGVRRFSGCWTALPLLLACPGAALAQDQPAGADRQATATATAEQPIDFSADSVTYNRDAETITAAGRVRMNRDGNYLAADQVIYSQKTGQVVADGNVVVISPQGDRLVGEHVVLADTLRDGTVDNLLIVLDSGGRIAAERATRTGGLTILDQAIYSPCPVINAAGCPKKPSWHISAVRVVQDPARGRIRFAGGRLNILGLTVPLLPIFSIGDGSEKGAVTGALIPDINLSTRNGLELSLPYYIRLSSSRDLTLTPHVYTGNLPALEARYRRLGHNGAFQVGGFATYGGIDSVDGNRLITGDRHGLRAYVEGNGRFQFSPEWRLTSSLRAATDKTVTRRYDLTRDDRLRNTVALERITPGNYIAIAGWAFQGLRVDDVQRRIPIALPAIDARWRLADPIAGGRVELQGNSLSILRRDGQDSQRAFASARWDLRRLTSLGQEVLLTAYARGDAYHANDVEQNPVAIYRGQNGWNFRTIGALAADARWPLVGPALGGTQRLSPRVQLVLTPPTNNLDVPNEDARSVDLEDSNLFALNRFPGYDRWEDGSRITYGAEYGLDRPNWSVAAVVGQSFRLTREPSLFPDGTGLTDRLSDIVGRTRVRFGRFVDLTHRYRIDKDSFALRRTELDLTVGTDQTYLQAGYLRLDRNISAAIEDLRDKEELRLAGRFKFARYWSVFGATVLDLTDRQEDPLSLADGLEPVRHRASLNYEDECLELGLSWKRDYERVGDFRKGSTFSFHVALKGLGR
jgi:LPS-assembly protein